MIDIEHLRKQTKPKCDPLDKATQDFVILSMAKMLEKEFQPAYIFANHRNWENGPWKDESGRPTPDVALGEREQKCISAIYEVETHLSLLDIDEIISHLKLFGDIHIELVLPRSKLEQVKEKLRPIPIQGFWTYTIDKDFKLTVTRDPENKSKILEAAVSGGDITI